MLFELTEFWMIIVNIVAWGIIHISVAYGATITPLKMINTNLWLFKKRNFEKNGKLYTKYFKIKKWKHLLPDGSAMFKSGFRKKHLKSTKIEYIDRFIIELCRAEITHWIVILFSPVFFLWNYEWVGYIMILYSLIANLPCILAQRYNRIRFIRQRELKN